MDYVFILKTGDTTNLNWPYRPVHVALENSYSQAISGTHSKLYEVKKQIHVYETLPLSLHKYKYIPHTLYIEWTICEPITKLSIQQN